MTTNNPQSDDGVATVAKRLSEKTGEPIEKYSAQNYELPDLDDLEVLDAQEYYDEERLYTPFKLSD